MQKYFSFLIMKFIYLNIITLLTNRPHREKFFWRDFLKDPNIFKRSIPLFTLIQILLINYSCEMPETTKENSVNFDEHNKIAQIIVETALREQRGYEYLRELCEIGPRLSGSENSIKAINWAYEKMKLLGFDKVWLQPVMVPHWERGDVESCTILNLNKKLSVLALGGSIASPIEGITA
jgi:hypothetical protein